MKKVATAGLVVTLLAGVAVVRAQPAAQKEHKWLQQLAGEWDYDTEMSLEPGKPPVKFKGTESARSVGEFWVVLEQKATFLDTPFTGIMTLGFNGEKKKYVGTWIDSLHSPLLHLEGTVDAAGKALTLLTEGPNPAAPGKLSKYKEVIEIKSKDHKVNTSSVQGEDGKWVVFMTVNYRRKK